MVPGGHHLDYSRIMYVLQESTKKKTGKVKFHGLQEFTHFLPDNYDAAAQARLDVTIIQ